MRRDYPLLCESKENKSTSFCRCPHRASFQNRGKRIQHFIYIKCCVTSAGLLAKEFACKTLHIKVYQYDPFPLQQTSKLVSRGNKGVARVSQGTGKSFALFSVLWWGKQQRYNEELEEQQRESSGVSKRTRPPSQQTQPQVSLFPSHSVPGSRCKVALSATTRKACFPRRANTLIFLRENRALLLCSL